jgi:cytochrome c oxidase assembly protein subunit 11
MLGLTVLGAILGMVGMSFAAVPLYREFCQLTGYAGTPNTSTASAPGAITIPVTVRFDANVASGLPWRFSPVQPSVTLSLGEQDVAFYKARNQSGEPVTGVALYNVTPEKVGKYFHKTACFCFNEQTLNPGQEMQFPLSFWVDPAIATDPNTADVHTITLSYTFYRSLDDATKSGALAAAGPHVGPLVR